MQLATLCVAADPWFVATSSRGGVGKVIDIQ